MEHTIPSLSLGHDQLRHLGSLLATLQDRGVKAGELSWNCCGRNFF